MPLLLYTGEYFLARPPVAKCNYRGAVRSHNFGQHGQIVPHVLSGHDLVVDHHRGAGEEKGEGRRDDDDEPELVLDREISILSRDIHGVTSVQSPQDSAVWS